MQKEPIHISTAILRFFELLNIDIMAKQPKKAVEKNSKIDPSTYGKTTNQGRDHFSFESNNEDEKPKKRRLKKGFNCEIDENGNVWENPNVISIGFSIGEL